MFDNVFDKVMPSKVTRCGWPWHGLVRSDEDGSLQVELPNETVIPLKATLRNPRGGIFPEMFSQEGTVFKFKDPRAPEIPAEEAATAGGLEWRSEYLFNPNQQVIYGDNSGLQQRGWLYHENGNNWKVTIYDSTRLRFVNAQVGGIQKVEYRGVTGDTANIPWLQVIDAVPDGSKVLLAHINGRSGNEPNQFDYVFNNTSFLQGQVGAWWSHPIAYFELTLTGLNPVIRRLKSYSDIKGTVAYEGYSRPGYITGSGSQAEFPMDQTFELNGFLELSNSFSSAPTGSSVYFEQEYMQATKGSLCSMFYRADGSIGEVTCDTVANYRYDQEPHNDIQIALTHTFTESEYNGSTGFEGPWHYIQLSARFDSYFSAKQTIYIDGVEQSTLECTEEVSASRPVNVQYRAEATGYAGPIGRWSVGLTVFTAVESIVGPAKLKYIVDGSVVLEKNRQKTIKEDHLGDFALAGASSRNDRDRVNVFNVVRYSPNMLACSFVNSDIEGTGEKEFIIGSVVVPNTGTLPGYIIKQPPLGGLYGSYNPITREVVRDTLTPVFWI